MIRTQVYLHKDQVQEITLLAKKLKKKKAKIIRALISRGLQAEKGDETLGDALEKLSALGKKLTPAKGPTDLSTNHDYYLYEERP